MSEKCFKTDLFHWKKKKGIDEEESIPEGHCGEGAETTDDEPSFTFDIPDPVVDSTAENTDESNLWDDLDEELKNDKMLSQYPKVL